MRKRRAPPKKAVTLLRARDLHTGRSQDNSKAEPSSIERAVSTWSPRLRLPRTIRSPVVTARPPRDRVPAVRPPVPPPRDAALQPRILSPRRSRSRSARSPSTPPPASPTSLEPPSRPLCGSSLILASRASCSGYRSVAWAAAPRRAAYEGGRRQGVRKACGGIGASRPPAHALCCRPAPNRRLLPEPNFPDHRQGKGYPGCRREILLLKCIRIDTIESCSLFNSPRSSGGGSTR